MGILGWLLGSKGPRHPSPAKSAPERRPAVTTHPSFLFSDKSTWMSKSELLCVQLVNVAVYSYERLEGLPQTAKVLMMSKFTETELYHPETPVDDHAVFPIYIYALSELLNESDRPDVFNKKAKIAYDNIYNFVDYSMDIITFQDLKALHEKIAYPWGINLDDFLDN